MGSVTLDFAGDADIFIARQADALRVGDIRRWLEEFARLTEDSEIVARFERAWTDCSRE